MSLSLISRARFAIVIALITFSGLPRVLALSCTTQAQMTPDERDAMIVSAKALASAVQRGNIPAVQGLTVAAVAQQFESIANTIRQVSPQLAGATLTIDALYGLDASDWKSDQEEAQFFCGAPNSSLRVDITIPQLPQGRYALTLLHATGVKDPQQMAFLLQSDGGWRLAGFFVKPLLLDGHDSVWYWSKARDFRQKGEMWNAYFYAATADTLSAPVGFLDSPNLEMLRKEEAAAKPGDLVEGQPLMLEAKGQNYRISGLHTDGSLGGLDLVMSYSTGDVSDPTVTRAHNLALMEALLSQHPELREGFHGLWVFANASNQRPFGIELPMSQIPQSKSADSVR